MQFPDLYPFKKGKLTNFKRLKDVDYLKAEGNYTGFHFIDGSSRTESGNIGLHWARIEALDFFYKIHRSYVVNLKAIKDIANDGTVLLKSGTVLVCSKKRLPGLLEKFPIH